MSLPFRRTDAKGSDYIQECSIPDDFDAKVSNPVEQLASIKDIHERRHACISEHLMLLYFIISEMNIKRILELGVGHGNSTIAFLSGLKKNGGKLTSVDIVDWFEARRRVAEFNLGGNWEYIINNDMNLVWNEELDLLFIDSSHEYTHTKSEIEKYEPFVRNGGYIIFHDTVICPQVEKAVDEFFSSHPSYIRYRWFHNSGLQVLKKVI